MLNMKRIIPQRGNDTAHRFKAAYHSGSIHCFLFRVDSIIGYRLGVCQHLSSKDNRSECFRHGQR